MAGAERMIHVALGAVPWEPGRVTLRVSSKVPQHVTNVHFQLSLHRDTDPKTDPRPFQAPPAKYVPTTIHGALLGGVIACAGIDGVSGSRNKQHRKIAITDWPGVSMRLRTCHTKQAEQGCGKCAICNGTDMREPMRARASRATGGSLLLRLPVLPRRHWVCFTQSVRTCDDEV